MSRSLAEQRQAAEQRGRGAESTKHTQGLASQGQEMHNSRHNCACKDGNPTPHLFKDAILHILLQQLVGSAARTEAKAVLALGQMYQAAVAGVVPALGRPFPGVEAGSLCLPPLRGEVAAHETPVRGGVRVLLVRRIVAGLLTTKGGK